MSEAMNKNTDLQNISNAVYQDTYEISEMTVKDDEQNQSSVSIVTNVKRKRGRPRKMKNNSIDQDILKSDNKIRVITDVSNLSDDSDTTNVEDDPIVKKRGRPVGTRGRGRGRRRGRGQSSGIIYNLDSEYVPKTTKKNVSQVEKLETLQHNNLVLGKTQ